MSVAEAQQRISSAEFTQWGAYYSLEPWGWEADNWRMGVVSSTVANAAGRRKPLKPSDFTPKPRGPKRRQTPAEQRAILESILRRKPDG